jgi:hypothetical protein
MHIAYACAGQVDNARVLLEEADKLSRSASDRQLVFEVAIYKEVSLPEYREYNNRMRQALTEGRLWDRMTLPVPVTGTVMG